ncbi:ribonuclease domain-containing protein, partial [Kitasatospora sp. NPDC094016]|uniref:ribonuclease domain-containing protein n=1 Tax=Kitasatospora sp. NPDC094016 TaxID=3154986 RepID=UPI00331E0B0E
MTVATVAALSSALTVLSSAPSDAAVASPSAAPRALASNVTKACAIWNDLKWPSQKSRYEYTLDNNRVIVTGGLFKNTEGHLSKDGDYREYDVNSSKPSQDASRGKERLVRDRNSMDVWYTDTHYDSFTLITKQCYAAKMSYLNDFGHHHHHHHQPH